MKPARIVTASAAAILFAGMALAAQAALALFQTRQDNAAIIALASGRDLAVPTRANPNLQSARGIFLLAHGRPEEAQAIADRLPDSAARAGLLYNLGNFMLRRGLTMYFTRPMRETAPVIRIAQAEYREALHLNPDNWDARFNLDVANALVRDADAAKPTTGFQMAPDKATIPDEPGAPAGLP